MSHECEGCGETFETLTRLRLHECGDDETPADIDETTADSETARDQTTSGNRDATVPDLDDALARIDDGEEAACYEAVAISETTLTDRLDADDGGDQYRDVFWEYYVDIADRLDAVARDQGWAVLADLTDAYDPMADDTVPQVTPSIANAVGRHVIRTRLTGNVHDVPGRALDYLRDVASNADEYDDVTLEEVHAYGWGIGHPDHPVADTLHARAEDDIFWVHACLEEAFYADQRAAVDLLERIVTDDLEVESRHRRGTIDAARHLLDAVVGPDSDQFWPTTPRGFDWHEKYDYTFEWDPEVSDQIERLVVETDVVEDLDDNWTFQDLAL